jgi:hypothetical protein
VSRISRGTPAGDAYLLLAAFETRRPTKDVDLAGLNLVNSTGAVLSVIQTVLKTPPTEDDGIEFFPDTATADADVPDHEAVGRELHLLYDAASVAASADRDPSAAAVARNAAAAILDRGNRRQTPRSSKC